MLIEEIKNLTANTSISGVFAASNCLLKAFEKKDDHFLSCNLADKTGSAPAIMWSNAKKTKQWLRNKTVVEISGKVSIYRNQPQIVIEKIAKAETFDINVLLPTLGPLKIMSYHKALYNEFVSVDKYKFIWEKIFADSRFKWCPGGVGNVHHNYLGGLIEHCYEMVIQAERICSLYPELDRQLLKIGALIHDIGKLESYSWDTIIEMSDEGRLFGHTAIGFRYMSDLLAKSRIGCTEIGTNNVNKLLHIILSHHGEKSMIKPMFAEAAVISCIDSNSASVNYITNFIKENKQEDSNWTSWSNLTQTFYYLDGQKTTEIPVEEKKFIKEDDDINEPA